MDNALVIWFCWVVMVANCIVSRLSGGVWVSCFSTLILQNVLKILMV